MEDNKLSGLHEEIEKNNNQIKNEEKYKPNNGYDFAKANVKKEKIMETRNIQKQEDIKKQKRLKIKVIIITAGICSVLFVAVCFIFFARGNVSDRVDPTNVVPLNSLSQSKILSGKSLYDIELYVNDARIVNNQIEIQFTIENKSKNTYFPLPQNCSLTDNSNNLYENIGFIANNDETSNGIKPGGQMNGLIIFKDPNNGNARQYTLSFKGTDIEHFLYSYNIPFSIS